MQLLCIVNHLRSAPHWAFAGSHEGGPTVFFSVVLGWSGVFENVLSCCVAIFLVLWLERTDFCWVFFGLHPLILGSCCLL